MKTPEEWGAELAAKWYYPASICENPMNLATEEEKLAALAADYIRAAVAEAMAGERERCLWVIGEAVRFWENVDGEVSIVGNALEGVATSIRSRGEGGT